MVRWATPRRRKGGDLRSRAEQEDHAVKKENCQHLDVRSEESKLNLLHQSMGEPDFGTIYGTIAGRFDDGKERRKIRVKDYAVDEILASD